MRSLLASPYPSQARAFEHIVKNSVRLAVCLNGAVPVHELAGASSPGKWLDRHLAAHHPEAHPGPDGPITIVLVL